MKQKIIQQVKLYATAAAFGVLYLAALAALGEL